MAAQTQTHVDSQDLFDVHALVARWTASHREAAEGVIDAYQKTVRQFADAHLTWARSTNLPAVVTIAETQATLSRDTADAYVRSLRDLLEL